MPPLRFRSALHDPTQISDRGINPYLAQLKSKTDETSDATPLPVLYGQDLEGLPGRWRDSFAAQGWEHPAGELYLEIGTYKGKTLCELAARAPNAAFVGMDITYKRVVLTGRRIARAGLSNAAAVMAHANAASLKEVFAPRELSGAMIFFPDPWSKKRHEHNRLLTQPGFARCLHDLLRPGGFVWLKTDQEAYFSDAAREFENAGFERVAMDAVDSPVLRHDAPTPFEERFLALGLPISSGVWVKARTICEA